MAIPTSISFCWPSTNASIPAGWERNTAFDGLYPFWTAADDANTTGGAATHTHTFTSATHTFSAAAASDAETTDTSLLKPQPASTTHTHASKNCTTGSVTSGATNNNPPYINLIFIKPSDSSQTGVPDDAWALSDGTVPTGWTEPSDCDNKLFKGAATGGNADLTGGGSTDHLHSLDHTQPNTTSNAASGKGSFGDATDNDWYASGVHYHTVSFASADVDSASDANSSMPLWQKLLWIKNETGAASALTGIVGFYLGTVAAIPANWARIDPTSRDFIMGAVNAAEVGNTGGNSTHTHTGTAHTHTPSAGAGNDNNGADTPGTLFEGSAVGHTHVWTVGNATDTVSANSSKSHYPSYIKTILLKYTEPAGYYHVMVMEG